MITNKSLEDRVNELDKLVWSIRVDMMNLNSGECVYTRTCGLIECSIEHPCISCRLNRIEQILKEQGK
jgi:hypothetical protein